MPEQSSEDLRERRRRQNRESQQRWRQRHKKSHSNQSRPRTCAEDDLHGSSTLLSPLSSLPPDFFPEPHVISDRVDYKTSWIHKQPAAAAVEGLPLEPWHMGFPPTGGDDIVDGASHNPSEVLTNKVIEAYSNSQSYMHNDGAGGYPPCSGPFSQLELSLIKENGVESSGLSRGLSSSIQALGGGHLEDNEHNCFSSMIKMEPESHTNDLPSPAEVAINEVQELYNMGVKVGFLKRDDRVHEYLVGMKRVYHRAPYLKDGECQACCCCFSGNGAPE
ncbi:hypothetical protein E4U43_007933 [Claviceps pusilla]|uniref:BZIP domain-containing protein n=1 Tax=Claviceps pusilla TaxID=123648 RepID=A0A9P7NC71_9HYPO|nr:hypothetical protein E4U43_007933 [Claviceps pusilla]